MLQETPTLQGAWEMGGAPFSFSGVSDTRVQASLPERVCESQTDSVEESSSSPVKTGNQLEFRAISRVIRNKRNSIKQFQIIGRLTPSFR